MHAENTPSFSSFFARGKARTWAFFWLARCCWLSPGRAGSLFPDPEPVAAVLDPAGPVAWAWRSRGCKACAAGSDMSTLLDSSSAAVYLICCLQVPSESRFKRTAAMFRSGNYFFELFPLKHKYREHTHGMQRPRTSDFTLEADLLTLYHPFKQK